MLKPRETAELRRIKRWYEQIMRGERPTKAALETRFRSYTDQAELLIQRIDEYNASMKANPGKTSSSELTALPLAYYGACQNNRAVRRDGSQFTRANFARSIALFVSAFFGDNFNILGLSKNNNY
jgi:hypothetical protein